jgi:hypothetical protein
MLIIRIWHFGQRGRWIGKSSGSDLGMAASITPDFKRLGRSPLLCLRQAPFLKPDKAHCQLPQVVSGVADRQLSCSA